MTDWPLRRATAADAPAVAMVAAASFLESFAGILPGDDIVAHCARNSSIAKFAGWAAEAPSVVTLATHPAGGAPVGYSLLATPDLPVAPHDGDIELRRIYALSITRGTGLGHRLMVQAVDDARALGRGRILLGVLGTNVRARAFYEREGFVLAGERRFNVGAGWYDDVIYARSL
ncbi:GNAT family N-acetyltransferase [Sphingomonas radiodurans]|uniref:GNAT family N-acetyltransferase n=1 Tax=Sphingomonas radiodurans TaxID=2890321 RepID=UPI001E352C84|nr:GNAT family N-acetyltransferase [Sphingomonas radiodurans]WBH16554.1 GNAT family N-acetyltransferase [Sphingomonas radiodurans]